MKRNILGYHNSGELPIPSHLPENCPINTLDFVPVFDFEVCVDIGDGRTDYICLNEKSDPETQASKFCEKYKLDEQIEKLLTESLREQLDAEKKRVMHDFEEPQEDNISSLDCTNRECEKSNSSAMYGADKILSQGQKYYGYNKNSQQIWKQPQSPKGHPKMNSVSKGIVERAGKQMIIKYMNKKSCEKIQQHILQKQEIQAKQFQKYSFHPTINPISQQVDKTLRTITQGQNSRYHQLFEYHKIYEQRHQQRRRNSIKELSFRPDINNLSKQIINRKKSEGNIFPSYKNTNRHRNEDSISSSKLLYAHKKQKSSYNSAEKKYKGTKSNQKQVSNHLYEEARRRQEKAKKQAEKYYKERENWKIIDHSNQMINQLREQRIRQIYRKLSIPPHEFLYVDDIVEDKLDNIQKLFTPIFKQMKQMDTELNQEQFVQAGLRLLNYLSPLQKAMLIRKKKNSTENKQNKIESQPMNSKSKAIIRQKHYGDDLTIYSRGLMYKREIKEHVEKGKEEQVRKELQNCTFKPKINGLPSTYAY